MNLLVAFISLGVVLFLLWKLRGVNTPLKPYFFPALGMKIVAGISLGLVYTYYYKSGDTYSLFNDSLKLSSLAREDIFTYFNFLMTDEASLVYDSLTLKQDRSLFMTKCISVANIFSNDNYWISGFYFSVLSFWGAWFFVRRLVKVFPGHKVAAVISFLFLPSLVFWSSGISKESLAMGALFFLSGVILKLWDACRIRWTEWIFIPVALIFLWKLKYFYLGVFIPVMSTCFLTRYLIDRFHVNKTAVIVLLWITIFIIPVMLVTQLHPNFHPSLMMQEIVRNNHHFNEHSKANNLIHYANLQPTVESFIKNSPWALFSGIFRPGVWEADTLFKLILALENLLLMVALLFTWVRSRTEKSLYGVLVWGVLVYVVLLSILLSLSTPNLGTLVRYRIGYMPFLCFLVLSNSKLIWMMHGWINLLKSRVVR